MRTLAAAVLTLTLLTAGCLSGIGPAGDGLDPATANDTTAPTPSEVEAYALPRLVQDHEHNAEPAAHAGSIGFDHLAFAPMREEGSYPDGETYFEMAVKGDHAYVIFGPKSGFVNPGDEAGFVIFNVSDPAHPEEVGRWLGQPLGDIEVSNDGRYVFASTQRNGYPYPWTVNPDAGAEGHAMRGTFIVDVSDKANPETVSFSPLPTNGPHTITYVEMPTGRELLLQSTYDFVFTVYPRNVGQNPATKKVVITELQRDAPGGPQLEPLSQFQILKPDGSGDQYFPHDATVHVDPDSGRVIMDVAYWDLGLVTVDITDPSNPKELARFSDTGPSQHTQTHLVRVFPGLVDGKTVAVLEPEIPTGRDDGQFTFVDLSDPADPKRLGYWSLPGEHVIDQPFVFSPHNFDLACGGDGQPLAEAEDYAKPCEDPTVVASHFHGGLWVLNASDPTDPRAEAFFFPNVTRGNVAQSFPFTGFATAFVQDGVVYAPEVWTGLHVLEYGG